MTAEDVVLIGLAAATVLPAALAWRLVLRWHRAAGTPPLTIRTMLAVLSTATCIAGVVFGLELYDRFVRDDTDAFAVTKTSQNWFDRHYRLNSWHLRDDVDYAPLKDPDRRRITFVGDSFTAGHGVKNVADRFANRIRADEPGWDVQVLAIDGLDTGAELDYLRDAFARGYQTDDVVLVYCPNDIGDLLPRWRTIVDRLYADFEQAGFLVHHSYALNRLYFQLIASRSPELSGWYPDLAAGYAGAQWSEQARRLQMLAKLVRMRKARLWAVTFPFPQTLGPSDPFAPAYARLDELWRKLRVPHLDLRTALAGVDPAELVVNPDDAHPNERAHALAAAAIVEFLRQPPNTARR
jgi:lysophospholipase L1-like esterase